MSSKNEEEVHGAAIFALAMIRRGRPFGVATELAAYQFGLRPAAVRKHLRESPFAASLEPRRHLHVVRDDETPQGPRRR